MDSNENLFFLKGDSECAKLARSIQWSDTALGDPSQWSQNLRNTVAMLLSSKFPMFLWWGEELVQFYNDAYRPSLGNGGKHPHAMGQKGIDCWPEIWEFISPLIEQVRSEGESVYFEDLLLPIFRNGRLEDVYWTFSYGPVFDETGKVDGVIVVCTETTDKVENLIHLNESKVELEFAVEAAELGTWDLNPKTGKFSANNRLKEWFGLAPHEEIPLTKATDVIIERDRQRVVDAIANALDFSSGGRYDIEFTIINPKNNQDRIVVAKGRSWFDAENNPYRFNGTLEDVTAQRKAEKEALQARQLTDLAIKSVGIGLFKIDFETSEIEYTPEFAHILTGNKNKKNLTRKTFISHVHPDDDHLRKSAIQHGIDKGKFYYTPRVIWEDGSVHRIAIMASQSSDDYGKPTAFSGTARDLTLEENQRLALEQAEVRFSDAQRQSEMLFRNVTNSSPTGLWLSDEQGGLTYLNRILVDWTGMSYEDLLGSGWTNAIVEQDRQQSVDAYMNSFDTRTHYDVLFRLNRYDGRTMWCRAAGDPFYNEDGSFAGYSGFCMDVDELINSRKAIAESEVLFRSIIEQAPVATCLFVGRDMKVQVANDIMLSYWGRDRSIMGLPLQQALPELEGQPFFKILDDVFTSGIAYSDKAAAVEIALGGIFGTYYFDFTYKALRNSDGSIYGVMNMAVDVTQQVLAQQQIVEQQRRLLESFEKAPVGIATIESENLTFSMANAFYGNLVGRKSIDLIGKPLLEAIPEIQGQGFDELLRGVIETGTAYTANEVPVNLVRYEKLETAYVDLTYQPRRDVYGKVFGILVVATDVTQQVLARKLLEEARLELHNAVELADLAVWKLDVKSNTFYYSKRFMKWLGFSEDSKEMDEAYNPVPNQYRNSVRDAIDSVLSAGSNGIYDNEHPIVNRLSGQVRIIHAHAQLFYDEDGRPEFLSGTAQDVTKERKLQQELEFKVKERTLELQQANAELASVNQALEVNNMELQQFAYIASHDLQEPIRKIAVFAQMLEQSLELVDQKSRGYLEKINSSTQRMTNLIRDVLSFSQLSHGTESFVNVDLNEIMRDITTEFELVIEQKRAIVRCENLPVIEAIPPQMVQLFGNLVSNALKYSKESTRPEISVVGHIVDLATKQHYKLDPEINYCKIIFTDNGIGFEQEYAEKIFNIFQRLHGKKEYIGTGIGLAVCRKIVQNHHGIIWAQSALGAGASFEILLPVQQKVER